MLCGLYELDITPRLEKSIPGYFVARIASGVRDPLFARALACENEKGDSFILVSLDAIELHPRVTARARQRVERMIGVPGENVMLASTHTHTGGPVDDFVPGSIDYDYLDWMADRAADAAVLAWENRRPAKLGYGSAREDSIAFIRRYYMKDGTFQTNPGYCPERIERPAGAIDPEVGVVKIEDMDGRLVGVITNYACHLDTVGGHRYCADYPGELHRVLKAVYGQDVVSIFLTGACGNINHCDFMGRSAEYYRDPAHPHYVRMGRILAGDVIRALADIETQETEELAVKNDFFTGYVRIPTPEAVAEAETFLEEHPYESIYVREGQPSAAPDDLVKRHYARSLLDVHRDPVKELTVPIQAARIGEAAIVGLPCELFVEFGLDVKARSAFKHTMISTLTNDIFGYIAVRDAFEQGGYEATISGVTKMGPETGYDMVNTAVRLLDEMK